MDLIPIGAFCLTVGRTNFRRVARILPSRFINDGAAIEVAKIIVEETSWAENKEAAEAGGREKSDSNRVGPAKAPLRWVLHQ